eukprot:gene11828-5159_t
MFTPSPVIDDPESPVEVLHFDDDFFSLESLGNTRSQSQPIFETKSHKKDIFSKSKTSKSFSESEEVTHQRKAKESVASKFSTSESDISDTSNSSSTKTEQVFTEDEFLKEISKDKKKMKIWKKYLTEKFVLEYYNFYEAFIIYNNEKNSSKKKTLADKIFNDFINPTGKTPIGVSQSLIKKVKLLNDNGSDKVFNQVFQQTVQTLKTIYIEYKDSGYEVLEHYFPDEIWEKKKMITSKNFEEMISCEKEMKLFHIYCNENTSTSIIECFEMILEYEINKDSKKISEIFSQFVKEDAIQPVIFNTKIKSALIEKYNSRDNSWIIDLRIWVYQILSTEVYPRFIHSKIWKGFVSSQSSNDGISKFEEKYEVIKVEKEVSMMSSSVQILSIRHQLTDEIFKTKKINTVTLTSNDFSTMYLDLPRHENLLQLSEIIKETNEIYQETTLFVITQDTPMKLSTFINDLNSEEEYLSQLDLYDLLTQIITALTFCHEKNYYFEIGSLTEFNIYLTETLDRCFIDPGFYSDNENQIPRYYTENEFGDEKTIKSAEEDIFAVGMIFFRLMTLISIEEIERMYEKEMKKKSPSSSKRRSLSMIVGSMFSGLETNEKPAKYLVNYRYQMFKEDKGYHEGLLLLILEMIDPIELKRPTAAKILETLQNIKQESLVRPSFLSQQNSLQKIMEGWSFEQKTIISDVFYRQFLKEFLREEFCVETILFFEDITKYKELKGTEKIEKANEILLSYLTTRKSILQVNVNAKSIKQISSNIKSQLESNGSIVNSVFDDALAHVMNTMMCDNYQRFEKSEIYEMMKMVQFSEKKTIRKKKKEYFEKIK